MYKKYFIYTHLIGCVFIFGLAFSIPATGQNFNLEVEGSFFDEDFEPLDTPQQSRPRNTKQENEETSQSFYDEDDDWSLPPTLDSTVTFDSESPIELDREPLPRIQRQRTRTQVPTTAPSYIRHPHAAKGLSRITRDRTYIYEYEPSQQTRAASLRFGLMEPSDLRNPNTQTSFTNSYDSPEAPVIFFDYEWQLLRMGIGKVGLKLGSGVFVANGNGRFANPDIPENANRTPREVFTFLAFPSNIGAIYRLQFWDNQILVPYGEGGGMAIPFTELRDDGAKPKFGGAFAGYFAGGLNLNLSFLERRAMMQLDREYGVNGVFLTAELRSIIGFGNFDFSSNVINGGLTVEF